MPEQKQTYSGGGAFSNIGTVCLSSHRHKPRLRLFPMHLGATAVEPSPIYMAGSRSNGQRAGGWFQLRQKSLFPLWWRRLSGVTSGSGAVFV